jgi:catechol 2,3-dioxygenase-like lactoylglutathione lyase family enzyme
MLEFHHTGLLVESIERSLDHYSQIFGLKNISKIHFIKSQGVKVCFIKNGESCFLELVEPIGEDSKVFKMLKKRISYYHIAYKVKHIEKTIKSLEDLNYKAIEVFNSEAFNNKKCAFLFTPDAHLVELIED